MTPGVADGLGSPEPERGRLGGQHFVFCTAVQALFSGWCGEERSRVLGAIAFDKVANLTARTWTAAAKITGDDAFLPVPFEERPGVHGPGQAMTVHRDQRPRYFLEVAFDLQRIVPERTFFDIRPWVDANGDPRPTDHRTRVLPGAIRPSREHLEADLPGRPSELLLALSSPLCQLDENQVRALGTHRDRDNTLDALHYQLRRLSAARDRALEMLDEGNLPGDRIRDAMRIACAELRRKALDNEDRYARARDLVLDGLGGCALARASFEDVHQPSTDIWGDEQIRAIRRATSRRIAAIEVLLIAMEATERQDAGDRLQERLAQALAELPSGHGIGWEVGRVREELLAGSLVDRLRRVFDQVF